MALALCGARVFDGTAMREGHAVVIDGDHIRGLVPELSLDVSIERLILKGGLLAPGFIDVQVNGGGGVLLNGDPSLAAVRRIAQAHRQFGTTGMLPTVITDTQEVLASAIAAVRSARTEVPGVLGIHIEGPFLDQGRKGAHAANHLRAMTASDIDMIAGADCGVVMLTVAPNRVTPAQIAELTRRGVLVSLGHAEADLAEAQAALQAGARAFTHIFNAMSQLTGREPGMVGAALSDPDSYAGVIADGHHVHDLSLQLALRLKRLDRIMLITDAMPAAAGGPDVFTLQGRTVRRVAGRLQLDDGTLAGSTLTMDEAVRYAVNRLGLGLGDALRMASRNPAAFLRRDHELGQIAPGYLASLVHLADDLSVMETWIDGSANGLPAGAAIGG